MPPADLGPETHWRDSAAQSRREAARALECATRCDLTADLLALDGVDLTLDTLTQPCALTRAALTGDP
jgi:hypothetical protein